MLRSNLLTTFGLLLVLLSVILLGYWKIAVGLLGVALLIAGYTSWRAAAGQTDKPRPASSSKGDS